MTTPPINGLTTPGAPSFLEELYQGRLRWDLVHPFPAQDPADRLAGDRVVREVKEFLREHVDPTAIDTAGRLPDELVELLRPSGFLKAQETPELGGLGLSDLNTFRMVEAMASWSMPVGLAAAIQNSIGVGPLARLLPPGRLRDLIEERVGQGLYSAFADTEPSGAANHGRDTTAIPDGAGSYRITGEKVFSGNAPLAELVGVVATALEPEGATRRLFVLDGDTPGLSRVAEHEFMGIKGFPNGAFSVQDAVVPADRVFREQPTGYDARITPRAGALAVLGRMYLIAAPSLAIAKLCLTWSRDFAGRRVVDGRGLGQYDEVQRTVADSLADAFAIETVSSWSLLCARAGLNPKFEQGAAKNITSVLCWRVVDRTMSLLAAEGYETARSKARRGAPPLPLERFFRDARGLRISGGVDFQLDYWMSQMIILPYYRAGLAGATAEEQEARTAADIAGKHLAGALGTANRDHLDYLTGRVGDLAALCAEVCREYPDDAELKARERLLIRVARIANELFTMAVVLARSAVPDPGGAGSPSADAATGGVSAADLADVYCLGARERIDADWPRRPDAGAGVHARISAGWLAGADTDEGLLSDIVTVVPPA